MATDTLSNTSTALTMREALNQAADALLTAQIMAGSLERLINKTIDEGRGDPEIWDYLNAALACTDKLRMAATQGLQATDEILVSKGTAK